MNVKAQRLFFALWPDEAVRQTIHDATHNLVRERGARAIAPENFHITLAFLGNVEPERLRDIRAAAGGVRARAFELTLDKAGYFPRPRLLWFGASVIPPPLLRLLHTLNDALKPCGFTPERRPYRPHVSLARKVSKPRELDPVRSMTWPIDSFALVRSVTAADSARYEVLESWPLVTSSKSTG